MGTNPDYPKDRVILPNDMYLLLYRHRPLIKIASKSHRVLIESMHGQDRWDNPRGSDVILRCEEIGRNNSDGYVPTPNREHPDDWVCVRRSELMLLRR